MVGLAAGAPEPVEGDPEAGVDVGLQTELLVAEGLDVLAALLGLDLGRRAVLVGAADVEHLVAVLAQEAGVDVGGEHRADEVAQVLDAVDVGKTSGDEVSHGAELITSTPRGHVAAAG